MSWEVARLLKVPSERIDIIPNGVDSAVWRSQPRAVAAARSRYAGDGPLLGYAGRLVYEKGVQHLVRAVPELRVHYPGLRLVIAGDGPHRVELQEESQRLKLQRTVSFAGFLDEGDLPAVPAADD